MRRLIVFMITLSLEAAFGPGSGKAQLLKSLTNNLKQTLQNRANSKANQTTNSLLDKVDSATRLGGTHSRPGVPGASGVPGTTSVSGTGGIRGAGTSADGNAVSAQDSAAAIKAFRSASGGSGYYYETMITITSKRGSTKDTSFMWLTNSGEGRSEMRIPLPGVQRPKLIVVGHIAQPKYSVLLDDAEKTYTLNVIDTALIHSTGGDYQVTRIGTETVSGYSCVHSRLVNTIGSGAIKSTETYDIWTSTAVPGYALFSKMLTLAGSQGGIFGALARAGAGGFLVKMTAGGGSADYSMTEILIRAQDQPCSSFLFQIPAGYSNSETSMTQYLTKP